jgi:hypothetical protein
VSDDLVLAELQDAVVDDDTLRRLFGDLAALAEILDLRIKGGATDHATGGTSLETARAALASGAAVQIVYRYQGARWIDTLIPGARGTRIVRSRAPV